MGNLVIIEGSACGYAAEARDGLARTRVRVPARAHRLVPHQLMRAALPAIRAALDASRFTAVVAPARAALHVVFSGIAPELSPDEHAIAHALSARLTSHLSHNIPIQDQLWTAYVGFLIAAHAASPLEIVVEDLRQLDACSYAILCLVLRADGEVPDVVVGSTSELPEGPAMDDRGIAWDIGLADLRQALGVLRHRTHQRARGTATEPCRCTIEPDPWDRSPDRTLAAGGAAPAPAVADAASGIVAAVTEVFAMFAFDTALHAALAALDGGRVTSEAARARLWGIAALAAHNRQFFSRGNHRLARFLLAAYREALAHETEPALRVALHYRLAVTQSRRLGDLADARQEIDRGLAELARDGISAFERGVQEAWLHNIDAMVRVRGGDAQAAFACCERAFVALTGVAAPERISEAEIAMSKLVLGENALTLASMTGDEAARGRWLARTRGGFAIWSSLDVVDALEQQRAAIDRLAIGQAYALGELALDRARRKLNPPLEHLVEVGLSDLAFRRGALGAAADHGAAALALAVELDDLHATQRVLELRASEIAEARGELAAAEQALHAVLARWAPAGGELALRIEVGGRLARLDARRGDREPALARIAEIIDLAADAGELDPLLAASCHAGEVAERLGLADDAQAAYASCLELLGEAPSSTPARELRRLHAVVGQARTTAPALTELARVVVQLPRMLARERDAWPLARALIDAPDVEARVATLGGDVGAAFAVVVAALADAAAAVEAVALPVSGDG